MAFDSQKKALSLDVVSYAELQAGVPMASQALEKALLSKGIVGIRGIPDFREKVEDFIATSRAFSALPENIKGGYAPDRASGDVLGYEIGAEKYDDQDTDDKKASYYCTIPDEPKNKWPKEIDLRSPYLALGQLMLNAGQLVLQTLDLNNLNVNGFGRMLHYHKIGEATNGNPRWCGKHFDHSVLTSLLPAHYFIDGMPVPEPTEAGLYIRLVGTNEYLKIEAHDKDILLFQVGEFGQIAANDRIKATEHLVIKAKGGIERYTLAVFLDADMGVKVRSSSVLTADNRYAANVQADGTVSYEDWTRSSYERYLAPKA